MSVEPGQQLLHYRLVEQIGEGGMGVVWRAEDTTLHRDVAIKFLPAAVAEDPDRLGRFDREAQLLASLNHPAIAGVFGLHEEEGLRFIAMELVPGEDLAEVIARGPMPHDKAIDLARQVADALEAAHERGVIHRDLKPANIKITPEGQIKVLDFGLAKAFEPDPTSSSVAPTMSPTLTSAGTVAGVILGTAAYMSPEQARGHAVDKRSDIWAFGCVLYEMLTGTLAFPGETISDTLASVLKLEPDWDALPADTPLATRRLLRRCLDKSPKKRLRDIGEARFRIDRTISGEVDELLPTTMLEGEAPVAKASRLPWVVAVVALLLAVAGWMLPALLTEEPSPQVIRFELDVAEGLDLSPAGAAMVLSPDGERLAYLAGDPRRLHVRRIDQFEGIALNGTENAAQPFFSPDGEWIGFFNGSHLKKVSIHGGAAVTLADVGAHRGGSWCEDGTIVYAPNVVSGLFRIPENGGEPQQLTDPAAEDNIRSHRWPHLLPGGNAVLFTVQPSAISFDEARIEVLDLATMERAVVANGGSFPSYASTGHVTYIHEGTLFAVPFDLDTLRAGGSPVPVVEQVSYDPDHGGGVLHFSPNGHLVYVSGSVISTRLNVAWIEPDGTVTPLLEEPRDYASPQFSPDGNHLALEFATSTPQEDVWVYDIARGAMSRLTFDPGIDMAPIWSPDGKRVVFSSLRDANAPNLYWKPADGAGEAERLSESHQAQFASSFSPDGKYLMFRERGSTTNWDLFTMRMEDREIEVFLKTEFSESNGEFSPDGKWVAYDSDESGRWEAYVRPFPAGGGRWQVSTDGGGNAVWSRDGKTLYYGAGSKLMAVDYTTDGGTFRPGPPRVAIEDNLPEPSAFPAFDLAPDGRFITTIDRDRQPDQPVRARVVLNWFEELADRVK